MSSSALQSLEGEDPLLVISANVADRFAAQGNWAAAAKIYCELAEQYPTVAVLHWNGAIALDRLGYNDAAIAVLKNLLAIEPTSAEAWRKLGRCHIRVGAIAEACECYSRLLDILPEDIEARVISGRLLRLLGKGGDALPHLEKVYEHDPAFPGVAVDLADEYILHGRFGDAARVAEKGLARAREPGLSKLLAHCDMVRMKPRSVIACGSALMDCADHESQGRGTMFAGLGLMLLPEGEQPDAREALRRHGIFNSSPTGLLYDAIVSGNEVAIDRAYNHWAHRFGQFSSTASMFYLKHLLAREGVVVTRRAPAPVPSSLSVRSLTSYGRLGHTLSNYLVAYFYCRHSGLTLETPEWQGHYIFELDEPLYREDAPWREVANANALRNFAATGDASAESYAGADIFSPYGEILTKTWRAESHQRLQYRPIFHRLLAPHLAFLRNRGETLVAVHLRYGDMVGQEAIRGQINIDSCLQKLREIWSTLERPLLYVASDDPKKAKESFAAFSPVTLHDLPPTQAMLEHLVDFYVIGQAQVVFTTRGGYGRMAAAVGIQVWDSYRGDRAGTMQPTPIWRD